MRAIVVVLLLVLASVASAAAPKPRLVSKDQQAVSASHTVTFEFKSCAPVASNPVQSSESIYIADRELTPHLCAQLCGSTAHAFMMLVGGDQCRCSSSFANSSSTDHVPTANAICSTSACPGDRSLACGDIDGIAGAIYSLTPQAILPNGKAPTAPVAKPTSSTPLLAAFVLVHSGMEQLIARTVASVRPHVDYFVIVEVGSTADQPKNIADAAAAAFAPLTGTILSMPKDDVVSAAESALAVFRDVASAVRPTFALIVQPGHVLVNGHALRKFCTQRETDMSLWEMQVMLDYQNTLSHVFALQRLHASGSMMATLAPTAASRRLLSIDGQDSVNSFDSNINPTTSAPLPTTSSPVNGLSDSAVTTTAPTVLPISSTINMIPSTTSTSAPSVADPTTVAPTKASMADPFNDISSSSVTAVTSSPSSTTAGPTSSLLPASAAPTLASTQTVSASISDSNAQSVTALPTSAVPTSGMSTQAPTDSTNQVTTQTADKATDSAAQPTSSVPPVTSQPTAQPTLDASNAEKAPESTAQPTNSVPQPETNAVEAAIDALGTDSNKVVLSFASEKASATASKSSVFKRTSTRRPVRPLMVSFRVDVTPEQKRMLAGYAVVGWSNALQHFPTDINAAYYHALSLEQSGKWIEATGAWAYCAKVTKKVGPEDSYAEYAFLAHIHLARALYRRYIAVASNNQTNGITAQQVITLYLRAAELAPHRAEPHFELGSMLATIAVEALPVSFLKPHTAANKPNDMNIAKGRAALAHAVLAAQKPFPEYDHLEISVELYWWRALMLVSRVALNVDPFTGMRALLDLKYHELAPTLVAGELAAHLKVLGRERSSLLWQQARDTIEDDESLFHDATENDFPMSQIMRHESAVVKYVRQQRDAWPYRIAAIPMPIGRRAIRSTFISTAATTVVKSTLQNPDKPSNIKVEEKRALPTLMPVKANENTLPSQSDVLMSELKKQQSDPDSVVTAPEVLPTSTSMWPLMLVLSTVVIGLALWFRHRKRRAAAQTEENDPFLTPKPREM